MMFKRQKPDADGPGPEPAPTPREEPPEETRPRTTCYPQDGDAPPPVAGQPRTTVYRQAVRWNRGGYDTVN
jgi:hypothetical protein